MGKKGLKAQITIYAGLIFGVILSLLLVLIESAVCAGARTRINSVVNAGVQSLFSQYSRPVLEKYEVFGGVISTQDKVEQYLYECIQENCGDTGEFNPYGIMLQGVSAEEIKMLTDDNGTCFYNEITEYMKYGQFDTGILEFVPQMTESGKTENMETVREELYQRQKEAGKIDGKILKLLMYVEGVKTTSSGFAQSFGKLKGTENFVKRICTGGTDFGQTGVENRQVYDAVSTKYFNITEALEDLKGELDWIIYVYYYPLTAGIFADGGFRSKAGDIVSVIHETQKKVEQALALIAEIEADTGTLMKNLSESRNVLDANREFLGSNISTAFAQEFDELGGYGTGEANSLCDINVLKEQLSQCNSALCGMENAVSALAGCGMDIDSIGSVYGMIDDCIAVCSGYPGSDIRFCYDNITLGKGESLKILESLKDVFSKNQLKLVLEDVSKVSDNKSSYKDLSSMYCNVANEEFSVNLDLQNLYQDFLYNKYVSLYFANYLNPNTDGILQYETEYILGKKAGDTENLKAVVSQLVSLRFVMNFSYIICDAQKKEECVTTAAALLGFTGVYGIIKLGEYLLLTAWAYGEAVNDVKILMNGGKVSLVKTPEQWKTQLEDILSNSVGKGTDGNAEGLTYGEYLQLLLFLEQKETKIFRTMDIMELNMIAQGYPHIRMYRYLYGIKCSARFRYYYGKYEYVQTVEFHY